MRGKGTEEVAGDLQLPTRGTAERPSDRLVGHPRPAESTRHGGPAARPGLVGECEGIKGVG